MFVKMVVWNGRREKREKRKKETKKKETKKKETWHLREQ